MNPETGLNVEKALKIIQAEGDLSKALPYFEPRLSQQKMMQSILEAYNRGGIALIEAGTGTGKSIAYLIPALLWACQFKEKTLISTNTITLQEQLINKDIPLLAKAMNLDIKAVLVKGMQNYVCRRKLADVKYELALLSPAEAMEIEKIEAWENGTKDGTRSELSFIPSSNAWEKVSAESDTCTAQQCAHYQECHFFKARRRANDAQILVANHHLLFADIACRAESKNYQATAILPAYSRVILDEAHNIEDVATEYFAERLSQISMLRLLARLGGEKNGKLTLLKSKLQGFYRHRTPKEYSSLSSRLNIDLPAMRQDLLVQIGDLFYAFGAFSHAFQTKHSSSGDENTYGESKFRLLPTHKTHPDWTECISSTKKLIGAIHRYAQAVNSLEHDLKALKDERLDEQTKVLRHEISALAGRLTDASIILENFIATNNTASRVCWIETQSPKANVHLVNAELDISNRLSSFLFGRFSTIILSSATLAANKQFGFMRERLGISKSLLPNARITENIFDSPFNFKQQALFVIPTDIPNPLEPSFIAAATEQIWLAIQASHGNAFVLFTSYSMLKTCYQLLAARLAAHRFPVLKQGDSNRQELLDKFKATERSVLFGTDSFWEGVDVAGDALRCVIIVKLPFKVPTEPIIAARTEAILLRGGDPFYDYSLPNAIVKFKQGFGRLIRNSQDRGCIVCLDNRLLSKNYGKLFLNSLPDCQHLFVESKHLQQHMSDFYRKTYHLVRK